MDLEDLTAEEAGAALQGCPGLLLPAGSTEQHGPMGLIGTDAHCARDIARAAAAELGAVVAPALAYAPAQFNMGFPGTISIRARTFGALFEDIVDSLHRQGVRLIYVLNGHGANLAPLAAARHDLYDRLGEAAPLIEIRSWWDFPEVEAIRRRAFGDWEGLHATPAEISLTQVGHRRVDREAAAAPPAALSQAGRARRAGDNHPPAALHAVEFPDGRVGAHSALADPGIGRQLLAAAEAAVVADFRDALARLAATMEAP